MWWIWISSISERLAGSFSIGAGLSDSQGAVITSSISQDNFLGTGKAVSFRVNTSRVNSVYDLVLQRSLPYYRWSKSRVSVLSYISTDAEEADISDFDSTQFGIRTELRYTAY